jgi:hypothetical protein
MGHKGGYLDEAYFRAEESRHLAEYRKVIPHLSIFTTQPDEKKRRIETMLDFLRLNGAPEEALTAFKERMEREKNTEIGFEAIRTLNEKLYNIPPQERFRRFNEILQRSSTMDEAITTLKKVEATKNGEHLLVESVDSMMKLLDEGWEIDRELNGGGRFIMKKKA